MARTYIVDMMTLTRPLAICLAAAILAASPVAAQLSGPPVIDDTPETAPDTFLGPVDPEDEPSLIEEGARLFFRGIITEMEPHMDSLRDLTAELEPALRELAEGMGPALLGMLRRVDDITHYSAPEFLDNGDIIIRRSPDAPPWTPPPGTGTGPPDAIDL